MFSIVIGDVGSRLLGFLATAYLARTLLPEYFGLVNIGIAVLGYLFLVTSPGIHVYGARTVAQQDVNEKEFLGELVGFRLFLTALCLISIFTIGILLFESSTLSLLVILYSLTLIPMALSLDWYFQGKEQMQPIGWSRIIINLVYLLLLFLLVQDTSDVFYVPASFFLGNLLGVFFLYRMLRTYHASIRVGWQPKSLFDRQGEWFQLLKRSLPMGVGTNLSQLSFNFPPLLLGVVSTTAAVGYFSAALRVVFFFMIFDRLIISLLLPATARYYKVAAGQLQVFLSFVLRTIVVVVLPICVGGTVLADTLLEIIYGADFAQAIPVFQWLIWYFFFSTLGSVYVFGLIGIGQEKIYAKMMTWGTALQLLFIVLGSVLLNAQGAAVGYVAGEAVIMILMVSRFKKFVRVPFWFSFVRPAVSSVLAGILLFLVRPYDLALSILIAAIVFGTSLVVFGGYTKEDFALLRSKLL